MNIIVCISNVPDTTTRIKFTADNKSIDYTGVQWIINPWDELALTRAIELKEAGKVDKIIVISVGNATIEATLRKALAAGADEAIRVEAEASDSFSTASHLAEAIKQQTADIILCGIESSDYNGSSVGGMLAEMLDLPSVSSVSSLEIEAGGIKITREIEGGRQQLETALPAVLVVQKGIAINPRIPSMRGIMTARTKPLKVIVASPVNAESQVNSYENPPRKSSCKMIDPENLDELVDLLHNEARVI
ncbi:MAG: electron transfer flavoprotein subunit beta/FixA family protein [Lentimicrobium sp.]|jgi:electron transfer flavoprotein beta subunit|nr:electron transfer flavoprotein subunit beta/FixA family protein [Lentimicrobium sp.]